MGEVKAAGSDADAEVFHVLLSHYGAKSFLYLCVFHELTDIFHAYYGTHSFSDVPSNVK